MRIAQKRQIHSGIYFFLFILPFCILASGCGEKLSAAPAGVYVDTATEEFLRKSFDEVKECTRIEKGKFEAISVVLMPPVFPCKYYPNGCGGEYVEPNLLKVGSFSVWRHEVIHHLLSLETGDPDPSHQNAFFKTCS
ncbi:MAG: hypothetical protein WBK96_02830 [Candidatus Manganitrophaceae bacterium]